MIDCLQKVTGDSLTAYYSQEREKWVLDWPGMAVICVDNIVWTQEVAEAIEAIAYTIYNYTY